MSIEKGNRKKKTPQKPNVVKYKTIVLGVNGGIRRAGNSMNLPCFVWR